MSKQEKEKEEEQEEEQKQKYSLKYAVLFKEGSFKKEELAFTDEEILKLNHEGSVGGTDMLFLCSIIEEKNGAKDFVYISKDGKTGETIDPRVLFQMWITYALALSDNSQLGDGFRAFAKNVFESFREIMTSFVCLPVIFNLPSKN